MSSYSRPTPVRVTVAYIDSNEPSDDRLRHIVNGIEALLRKAGVILNRADYGDCSYLYPLNIDKIGIGDRVVSSVYWGSILEPRPDHPVAQPNSTRSGNGHANGSRRPSAVGRPSPKGTNGRHHSLPVCPEQIIVGRNEFGLQPSVVVNRPNHPV